LPAMAAASQVNDFVDGVLFEAIFGQDGARVGEFAIGEESGVIGDVRFKVGGVENGVCMCWDVESVGGGFGVRSGNAERAVPPRKNLAVRLSPFDLYSRRRFFVESIT
jgi:hypothetical protein